MISSLLFLIAICAFLFYGVVGEDKTWLLAPAITLNFTLVTIALFRRASGQRIQVGSQKTEDGGRRSEVSGPISDLRSPISALLWMLFLIYGIAMIPLAMVPFESKLVMLLIGAVVGAYLVWVRDLTAFKDNRLLLGFLIFVVMLLALYGLVVHFRCPQNILWTQRYTDAYSSVGRMASTYICPNHFAHLMQMLMPFCLALLFIRESGLFLRLLCGYSLVVFVPPLFLTESRAGWLGAIAAIGVTACLMALRRSKKLFWALVILVPLCSTLLVFAGWRFSETFQRRATPVVEFLSHQSEEGVGAEARDFRPQTWADTIDMIREAPLFGFGPGNYRYTFPEHRKRFRGTRIVTGHPHNEYLELIADYGLVGFVLFALAWMVGLIRILMASLKAEETRHAFIGFAFLGTAAGTMVHSFFDFEMHVFPNAMVFAFLAATAAGPLFVARRKKGVGRRASEDRRRTTDDGGPRPEDERQRAESGRQKSEVRGQRSEDRRQGTEVRGERSENGSRRSNDGESMIAVGNQRSEAEGNSPSTINDQLSFNLRLAGAWLLAIGYLLMAILCLQTMSSAFIRALADKMAEIVQTRHYAPDAVRHAQHLYELAVRVDSGNWRAYKGMEKLVFNQRYYSLDRDEKVRLAEEEVAWYAKAYAHNQKDPEICSAYGKCLLFLAKARGVEQDVWSRATVDEELSRRDNRASGDRKDDAGGQKSDDSDQMPDIGSQRSEVGGQRSEVSDLKVEDGKLPAEGAGPQQTLLINDQQSTSNSFQTQGLELLREACRYRPFNDVYWWTLGVELRKLERYDEALEVFEKARSIRRTPSTQANIQWIEAKLRAPGSGGQAQGEGQAQTSDRTPQTAPEWKVPGVDDGEPDPELLDLFERMGE